METHHCLCSHRRGVPTDYCKWSSRREVVRRLGLCPLHQCRRCFSCDGHYTTMIVCTQARYKIEIYNLSLTSGSASWKTGLSSLTFEFNTPMHDTRCKSTRMCLSGFLHKKPTMVAKKHEWRSYQYVDINRVHLTILSMYGTASKHSACVVGT